MEKKSNLSHRNPDEMRLNETVLRCDSYLNGNFDVHINTRVNKKKNLCRSQIAVLYKYERSFREDGRTQKHQSDECKRKHITSKSNPLLDVSPIFKAIIKVNEKEKVYTSTLSPYWILAII